MTRIGSVLIIPAIGLSLLLAACGGSSSSSSPANTGGADATVRTASNAKLGETILVDAPGMTLYRLSAERGGHWICTTKQCLALWHPLTGAPHGVNGLSTVKRPDGTQQIAFHGMPLYTFTQDAHPGDAAGQGFKDVGTWSAVTAQGTAAQTPTNPSSSSGGYGY